MMEYHTKLFLPYVSKLESWRFVHVVIFSFCIVAVLEAWKKAFCPNAPHHELA